MPLELMSSSRPTKGEISFTPAAPQATAWANVEYDGRRYRRETNTMPQWAGSCWYYLRYLDPHNDYDGARKVGFVIGLTETAWPATRTAHAPRFAD